MSIRELLKIQIDQMVESQTWQGRALRAESQVAELLLALKNLTRAVAMNGQENGPLHGVIKLNMAKAAAAVAHIEGRDPKEAG